MAQGDVGSAWEQLGAAWQRLDSGWNEVSSVWNDAVAGSFEASFIAPLGAQVVATRTALETLGRVIQQARAQVK